MGIYAVSGVIDGGIYLGATVDLERRRNEHLSALANDRHFNPNLQGACRTFGRENFVFLVLRNTDDPSELSRHEQEYITHYSKSGKLYNLVLSVPKEHHPSGYKLSEETRRKQSDAKKGKKKRIEQTRAKIYRFVNPQGKPVETLGLKGICEQYGLNASHLSKVASGKLRQHKGWTAELKPSV